MQDKRLLHNRGYFDGISRLMPDRILVSTVAKAVLYEVIKDEMAKETPTLFVSGNRNITILSQQYEAKKE